MVSQRQSGNTKMRKWKGIESYQDARLITVGRCRGVETTRRGIQLTPLLWGLQENHAPYVREWGTRFDEPKSKVK